MKIRRYKFTERTHSRRALIAIALAGGSIAGLVALVFIAAQSHGGASAYVGSAGLFLLLVGIAGLVVAIGSLREEDSFPVLPRISLALSALSCGAWIALYAWGFTL